jgi:hypothetical protein
MNQIAHLLSQLKATTNPEPSIPVQTIAPEESCSAPAVQPLASSSLAVKRVKSRKLQAKLRTRPTDEVEPSQEALDTAVVTPSMTTVFKDLPQYSGAFVVSKFRSCVFT